MRAPAPLARAGVATVQRTIRALADTVVVHEPSFADVVPGAEVVPHGIEVVDDVARDTARAALGVSRLHRALLRLRRPVQGPRGRDRRRPPGRRCVELVIAGGEHPRLGGGYPDRLRDTAPPNVRFTGYVPDGDVGRWFAAADVALLPYPRPFASSGPLALALAHRTPVLMSEALARTAGAPGALAVGTDPAVIAARLQLLAADPAERGAPARGRPWAGRRPHVAGDRPAPSRPLREAVMTVFLAGAFGQGNPGDEALLQAFARELAPFGPVAASADPAATTAEHGVPAVHRDNARRVSNEIARANGVVVAGGTIFKTLHPTCGRAPLSLLRRTAALAAVTRGLRKPLALVGVGAAPLRGRPAATLARAIVRASTLLILRDEESAMHLADAGAPTPMRVGADAAWTLVGAARPAATDDDRPVVVALSHLAGGRDLAERLAAGLGPVVASGLHVRLDPWQPDGDAELAAAVASRLAVEVAPPPGDLFSASRDMAGARLVLAQRFHALVAAAGAGVPALAVAHEPKLEGLARRLGQPAVAADAPPATLATAVLDAVDGPPPAADAVERERAAAEEAFRLLRVLLARGRTDEAVDVDGLALRPEEWLG